MLVSAAAHDLNKEGMLAGHFGPHTSIFEQQAPRLLGSVRERYASLLSSSLNEENAAWGMGTRFGPNMYVVGVCKGRRDTVRISLGRVPNAWQRSPGMLDPRACSTGVLTAKRKNAVSGE